MKNLLLHILRLMSMKPDTVKSVENSFTVPSIVEVVVITGTKTVIPKLIIFGLSSNPL